MFDPRAPEFVPDQVRIEAMPEVIQDIHVEWTRTAFSWEGEETFAEFTTWFVDQHDPALRVCRQARNIQLTSQFMHWESQIRRLWQDVLIDGAPSELVLVLPRPPQIGRPVAAHILLVQRPQPEFVTSVITVFDRAVPQPGPLWQLALTTYEHIFLEHIIHSLGLTQRCLLAGADRHCSGWYGNYQLIYGQALQGRDGYSIVVMMAARLQVGAMHPRGDVLETQDTHQIPQQAETLVSSSTTLNLEACLPLTEAVKVRAADAVQPLPHYIEIVKDSAEQGVADELRHWGLLDPVFQFGQRNDFLYFNINGTMDDSCIHYMLCNDDLHDDHGSFLHTENHIMSDQAIMRFLHSLGYERAVVLSHEELLWNLRRIRFWNCQPTSQNDAKEERNRTPWPRRSCPAWEPRALFPLDSWMHASENTLCSVDTPFKKEDIIELLHAGQNVLCTDFSGLDLPTYIEDALTNRKPGDINEHWDRWLIFTDGSSQTRNKHFTPEYADAISMPDTWAMLVLGERFISDTDSEIIPIGWTAHPVRTDPSGSCFAGSTRIGADVAEREGLLWAGLWRLTINQITPTIFCVDSQITGGQADGTIGTADPNMTYRLLRGTFQCLQAGLPPQHVLIHHVKSHTGDPFNEFVDHVAKREAKSSHNHPRLQIDLQKWHSIIPSLWLCFGHRYGLPVWNEQLHTPAPELPPVTRPEHWQGERPFKSMSITCQCSLATMNVQSISKGPLGHSGKLLYLFEQVKAHGLNIVGVQEGRNDEVLSTSHDILRIGAGHHGGQFGVELWINLVHRV